MNTTALSQIQRQSIHECIIECHQQNSTPPIHKDEYILESHNNLGKHRIYYLKLTVNSSLCLYLLCRGEALTNGRFWPIVDHRRWCGQSQKQSMVNGSSRPFADLRGPNKTCFVIRKSLYKSPVQSWVVNTSLQRNKHFSYS